MYNVTEPLCGIIPIWTEPVSLKSNQRQAEARAFKLHLGLFAFFSFCISNNACPHRSNPILLHHWYIKYKLYRHKNLLMCTNNQSASVVEYSIVVVKVSKLWLDGCRFESPKTNDYCTLEQRALNVNSCWKFATQYLQDVSIRIASDVQ